MHVEVLVSRWLIPSTHKSMDQTVSHVLDIFHTSRLSQFTFHSFPQLFIYWSIHQGIIASLESLPSLRNTSRRLFVQMLTRFDLNSLLTCCRVKRTRHAHLPTLSSSMTWTFVNDTSFLSKHNYRMYLRRKKAHHTRMATRAPREILSDVSPTSGRWQCGPLNPDGQAQA